MKIDRREHQDQFTDQCIYCQEYVCICSKSRLEFKLGGSTLGRGDYQVNQFMLMTGKWMSIHLPPWEDREEVMQDAVAFYLTIRDRYPNKELIYYRVAAVNERGRQWKITKKKREAERMYVNLQDDFNESAEEFIDLFRRMDEPGQKAMLEILTHVYDHPEETSLPKSMRRKLRRAGQRL